LRARKFKSRAATGQKREAARKSKELGNRGGGRCRIRGEWKKKAEGVSKGGTKKTHPMIFSEFDAEKKENKIDGRGGLGVALLGRKKKTKKPYVLGQRATERKRGGAKKGRQSGRSEEEPKKEIPKYGETFRPRGGKKTLGSCSRPGPGW